MKNIYTDNIPAFEEYLLIDLKEDDWAMLKRITKNKSNSSVRGIDDLYIKGVNIKENNNMFSYKSFLKNYLELGKKLFDLAMINQKIKFKKNYVFDNNLEINEYYLQRKLWEEDFDLLFNLCDEEKEDFYEVKEKIEKLSHKKKTLKKYTNQFDLLINLSTEILTSLLILNIEKTYPLVRELPILLDILNSTINLIDDYNSRILFNSIFEDEQKEEDLSIEEILSMCNNDLNDLSNTINDISKKLKFNLKKEISFSDIKGLKNISNINISNKYKEPILIVKYSYNQFEDLKDIIIPWLKKYGFPYFVSNEYEQQYHQYTSRILPLKENEEIIPCNILIVNSIFNYMYYTLFKEWKTADKRILEIFGFDKSKSFRDNRKKIIEIKNYIDYFNNNVCTHLLSNVYEFSDYINNIFIDYSSFYEEDSFNNSDNYFLYEDEFNNNKEKYFNNVCLAINEIVKNETKNFFANHNLKKCSICGKTFEPDKYRLFCSIECKRKKEALKKKKQRERKKLGN